MRKSSAPIHPDMGPLLIRQELLKGRTHLSLAYEYDLQIQQDPLFPNLIWFGNSGCDMSIPLVRQCRGLILDSAESWKVIARPLDHLFEWSAQDAPTLDWEISRPRIYDKIDGYMVYMWFYNQGWHLGSRLSPDASEVPLRNTQSLNKLFWDTFHSTKPKHEVPPLMFQTCTFIWEIRGKTLAPVHRPIADNNCLTLIGIRNNDTGEHLDPESFCRKSIRGYIPPFVDETEYDSMKDVLQAVVQTGLKYGEGVVIVDGKGNRVAVTHPEYNYARDFRDNLSLETVLENVRSLSPSHSIYEYAPDWVPLHSLLARCWGDLIKRCYESYDLHKAIEDDTTFAARVEHYPWKDVLIEYRISDIKSLSAGLRKVPVNTIIEWMEVPTSASRAA